MRHTSEYTGPGAEVSIQSLVEFLTKHVNRVDIYLLKPSANFAMNVNISTFSSY